MPLSGKYNNVNAALLTPPGFGAIAVIGLQGQSVTELLSEIFTASSSDSTLSPGKYYLGQVRDSEQVIDQVMIVLRQDSTCEITAEINCHGGPRVIQRILLLLSSLGVQLISWQLQDNSISIEAEQKYSLCTLSTGLAVSAVAAQYPDGLALWCKDMAEKLDLGLISTNCYRDRAVALLETVKIAQRLTNASKVFLTGPPNAGKSTLANLLTGRSQSLVSDLPGTTRDWTSELTEMVQLPVELIDTAGRRRDGDDLEMLSLARLQPMLNSADVVVILIPAEQLDNIDQIISQQTQYLNPQTKTMVVVSKAELLAVDKLTEFDFLAVSSITQQGIRQLKETIRLALGVPADFEPTNPLIFTARQQSLIRDTLSASTGDDIASLLRKCLG